MPLLKPKSNYLSASWKDLSVYYTKDLDGGGLVFADDYIDLLSNPPTQTKFERVFEWCSGPGFIGYSLLAHGFGTSLCLADCYAPAIEAATYTAEANNIGDQVSLYLGDGILALPEHEKFSLVVGNPPHFPNRIMMEHAYEGDPKTNPRIYVDPDWRLHKQFFSGIRHHLTQNGRIILVECSGGSHLETFRPMVEAAGLVVSGWQWSRTRGKDMWYLFLSRDDATEPFPLGKSQD